VQEVMETGLEVRVAMDEQAGLLVGGGAAGAFALALNGEAVDQDVVDAGPFTGFGGEAPVEAGGLEGDQELGEAVLVGKGQGLGEEAVDFVGGAAQATTSEDLAIVGEGGGVMLPGQVDTENEGVRRDTLATPLAFGLFSPEATGNEGSGWERGRRAAGGRSEYFGHGRLTSHVLGDDLWDTKPARPNLGQPPTLPRSQLPHTKTGSASAAFGRSRETCPTGKWNLGTRFLISKRAEPGNEVTGRFGGP